MRVILGKPFSGRMRLPAGVEYDLPPDIAKYLADNYGGTLDDGPAAPKPTKRRAKKEKAVADHPAAETPEGQADASGT